MQIRTNKLNYLEFIKMHTNKKGLEEGRMLYHYYRTHRYIEYIMTKVLGEWNGRTTIEGRKICNSG